VRLPKFPVPPSLFGRLSFLPIVLGIPLLFVGLAQSIGFFGEANDLSRVDPIPTLGGFLLIVWGLLGIRKRTPLWVLPPVVLSIALLAYFYFSVPTG
jgi:hypothetical protein